MRRSNSAGGSAAGPGHERIYDEHVARLEARAESAARLVAATDEWRAHDGAPADVVGAIVDTVDRLDYVLFGLVRDLYENPEVGFGEFRTVEAISALLAAQHVDVQAGVYGLPTAFLAEVGAATGPCVAIVAEYDALPGIGHGCGHNLIAAAAVGAFLATREVAGRTGGRVRLMGTPAEEGGGGKELILRAGGFDDVDAAIMVHPGSRDVADPVTVIGRRGVDVVYSGRTAHASIQPYLGRNALDAAVLAYQGIAQLRQHILPTDRVHGIITDGGQAANVVPQRAALSLLVRSAAVDTLAVLSQRVDAVLRASALSTGTECDIHWDPTPPYLSLRTSKVLADRYMNALEGCRDVLPSFDTGESGGSTDMGNVSHWVPAIQPMIAFVPPDVPGHSPELARRTITPAGRRAVRDGAVALARVAADFLSDERMRSDTRLEFEHAGGRLRAEDVLSTHPSRGDNEVAGRD